MSAKDTPASQAAEPGRAQPVDVAGGARLGYLLLSLILLSSLMAMLLQALSARLGIASGLDLRLLADFAFG